MKKIELDSKKMYGELTNFDMLFRDDSIKGQIVSFKEKDKPLLCGNPMYMSTSPKVVSEDGYMFVTLPEISRKKETVFYIYFHKVNFFTKLYRNLMYWIEIKIGRTVSNYASIMRIRE